jgi:hypothetical protein
MDEHHRSWSMGNIHHNLKKPLQSLQLHLLLPPASSLQHAPALR